MQQTDLYINGQWRPGSEGARFDVLNPADESVLASVASATPEDAIAAIDAADAAFADWAGRSARERSEIIFVPQHAVSAMVQEMPSLWLHFAELATEQLVWAVRGYAELIRLSPRAQIASRLHGYTFPWGGGGATVPIRQEELAAIARFLG